MDLNELRLEIDKIDDQLVQLFAQRMEVSARIGDYKKEHDLPILVPQREQEKLLDVAKKAGMELEVYTRVLYSMLFELSRGYQSQRNASHTALYGHIRDAIANTPKQLPKDATVACMGREEEMPFVCRKFFGDCRQMPFKNIDGILSAVKQGLCAYGILPVGNNRKQIYDFLTEHGLYILRTLQLKDDAQYLCIGRQLQIFPGADRSSICMALSDHPGALYKVLSRLYTLGINVVRLESRPIARENFRAMFYFDLQTSVYSEEFVLLICELGDLCQEFAYLGSYTEVV